MRYEDITGQQEAKRRLIKMVNESRVPHALLFTGREGSGNLPAAIAFSQHLLCTAKTASGPCNECPSCTRVAKLVHPDLHIVFPIALSKETRTSAAVITEFREELLNNAYLTMNDWFEALGAENKQPVIAVDEAAAILTALSYTSFEGSYKIMVIWQPERMNIDAANKLLKLLEEPPEMTVFVMVANQPEKLLPTILSRVQQIPFHSCSEEEIVSGLVKNFGVSPDSAREAAILANGNYGEAIRNIAHTEESVSLLNRFQSFMRIALRFDCGKAIEWIDENATSGRERQKQFFQYALEVFRDCLMYNFGERNLVRLSGQERQFLEKFAPFVNQMNFEKLVEEFNNDYYYIERNANPKILFMDLILKTNELINIK